jgi:collagen type III alpha
MQGAQGLQGEKGLDGVNGLGFDDFEEEMLDDGRVIVRRYKSGDRVKEFRHQTATMIYRGVYQHGKQYERGDVVTWSGATWHTNVTTATKPDEGHKDWTLMVKRGRDGKDGINAQALPVVRTR